MKTDKIDCRLISRGPHCATPFAVHRELFRDSAVLFQTVTSLRLTSSHCQLDLTLDCPRVHNNTGTMVMDASIIAVRDENGSLLSNPEAYRGLIEKVFRKHGWEAC